MLKILLSIFLIFNIISFTVGGPQTTIAQGVLEGKELINENGKVYHSYSGIPYAKPPLGNLRFKPPEIAEPWAGVRNATEEGNACRSKHFPKQHWIGDEDCLFLNVYSPQTASDQRHLPVMVWIHGGGFVMGSGNTDLYGPDWLMDYDVTLVTFNYRLGPLGFLSLDIEEAPGNVGMLDQVAALRWVQENISAFGGDPDNVTIFGESAGGASVHYLVLSDTTRGLFHKAIAQSGSAFNPWAFQRNHIKHAFQLCEALGHITSDPKDALEFLLRAPVDEIVKAKMPPEIEGQLINDFTFVPSLEKRFPTHEPFLAETALIRMQSGRFNKVPMIIGFNSGEGILFLKEYAQDSQLLDKFDADFERFVPTDLELPLRSEASVKLAKEIKKYYFGDQNVSEDNIQKYVDLLGDAWFTRGINDNVKLTIAGNSSEPVFYYKYSFTEFGFMKDLVGFLPTEGACHCDELGYLFKNEIAEFPKDKPNVVRNQKRLLELWTNFAKTGNPTPDVNDLIPVKWEPVTKDKLNYLSIDEVLTMGTNPEKNRVEFWENATKHLALSHL